MVRHLVGLSLLALLIAGCATMSDTVTVQRAVEGPRSEEIWMSRFVASYGRIPTYSESARWKEAFDQKVAEYLGKHPDLLTSPRASQFRFERRVFIGMSKEEILLLVDAPQATTGDEAVMRVAAKNFWPEIQQRAKEMWLYPSGWQFYFAGDRLVDLTVAGQPPLE